MLLANVIVNEENVITNLITYPLDEKLPVIQVEQLSDIHLGIDKFVDGKIVRDEEKYKEKLEKMEKAKRIQELKKYLADTDYKVFKYMDGEISEEDYAVIKQQRMNAREEIRRLEEEVYAV